MREITLFCPNCKKHFPVKVGSNGKIPDKVSCIVCGYQISHTNNLSNDIASTIWHMVYEFFLKATSFGLHPDYIEKVGRKEISQFSQAFIDINLKNESKTSVYRRLNDSDNIVVSSWAYERLISKYHFEYRELVDQTKELYRVGNMGNPDNLMI